MCWLERKLICAMRKNIEGLEVNRRLEIVCRWHRVLNSSGEAATENELVVKMRTPSCMAHDRR